MQNYKGSCHCGSIRFSFLAPEINDGMLCDCSICRKKGAVMTNFTVPPQNMSIQAKERILASYEFNSKVAKHHFCRKCGIFTFVQTRLNPGEYRINIGCIEGINPFKLKVEIFDGESI